MDSITALIIATLDPAIADQSTVATDGAYQALKETLRQKVGSDSELIEAINHLEKKPGSAGRQQVLREEIAAAKANQDPDVLAAAQTLLDLLDERLDHSLNIQLAPGTESPTDQPDPADSDLPPQQRRLRSKPFIGRETALRRLIAELQPGEIVNLCGPAGIGKTALAAEAVGTLASSGELSRRFPDGVIYHSFYHQPPISLAMEQIAREFSEQIWPAPPEAAQRTLAERRVLLVLAEADRADDLSALLAISGACGVVLTSRTPLNDTARIVHIPPLSLDQALSLFQASSRAQPVDNPTARQICELVGGLPLAVKLAARHLAQMPAEVTNYVARLKETRLARLDPAERLEQSAALLIEYGLSQMSDNAQQALAVAGLLAPTPFGAEVITEALATGGRRGFLATVWRIFGQSQSQEEPSEADQISEERLVLDELVKFGFLRRVRQRYEISHPLIHSYARQHLLPPAKAIERLVDYYTSLVGEQILLGLGGYTALDRERPHIMSLLATCVGREEWEPAYSLASAIEDYLDLQGHRTERLIANESGLLAARKLGRRHNEGAWLGNLGLAYSDIGQVQQAIEYYKQALIVARELGDRRSEGNNLGKLGLAYRDLGQIEQARQYLKQALLILEEINSPSAEMIQDWLTELEEA